MAVRKRLIAGLAVLCAFVLALSACGFGDPKAEASKNFVGTWELESMNSSGQETSAEDLALLKSFGMSVYLTVEDDGSALLEMFGSNITATWTAKDATNVTLSFDGSAAQSTGIQETTQDVSFADGKLTMSSNNDTMVFKKIDPSEKEAQVAAAPTEEAAAQQEAAPEATETPEAPEAPAEQQEADADEGDLAVGASFERGDGLTVTVNEVETGVAGPDDTELTRVNVSYSYAGTSEASRGPADWKADDAEGALVEITRFDDEQDILITGTLSEGDTATGNLYFAGDIAHVGYYAEDATDQPTASWAL